MGKGINRLARSLPLREEDTRDEELMLRREWLVTNGLGGFAAGTI